MKRHLCITSVVVALIAVLSVQARADDGLPLINSAAVNYNSNPKTLTISGVNFGAGPKVTLGTVLLSVQSVTSTQIVANFPAAMPPTSFVPGDYFLKVVFANQWLAIFDVTLGATGTQGPMGPQGPQGPAGPAGPTGSRGVTGPAGAQGSTGATGAAGTNGSNGATGATGPAGPTGGTGGNGLNGVNGKDAPSGGILGQLAICPGDATSLAGLLVHVPGRAFNVFTGADGKFQIDLMPAGTYSLSIERGGVQVATVSGIPVGTTLYTLPQDVLVSATQNGVCPTQNGTPTCNGGTSCVNGACTSCAPYVCGGSGLCETVCASNGDCQGGFVCTAGQCVTPPGACVSPTDCPANVNPCIANTCTGGVCGTMSALPGTSCGTGMVCNGAGGVCISPLPTGASCVTGTDCVSGTCSPMTLKCS